MEHNKGAGSGRMAVLGRVDYNLMVCPDVERLLEKVKEERSTKDRTAL